MLLKWEAEMKVNCQEFVTGVNSLNDDLSRYSEQEVISVCNYTSNF